MSFAQFWALIGMSFLGIVHVAASYGRNPEYHRYIYQGNNSLMMQECILVDNCVLFQYKVHFQYEGPTINVSF